MIDRIYLIEEKVVADDEEKQKSTSSAYAYENPEEAFSVIQHLISENTKKGNTWKYVFGPDVHHNEIRIEGKGMFFFGHGDDTDIEKGTYTITIRQIALMKEKS